MLSFPDLASVSRRNGGSSLIYFSWVSTVMVGKCEIEWEF